MNSLVIIHPALPPGLIHHPNTDYSMSRSNFPVFHHQHRNTSISELTLLYIVIIPHGAPDFKSCPSSASITRARYSTTSATFSPRVRANSSNQNQGDIDVTTMTKRRTNEKKKKFLAAKASANRTGGRAARSTRGSQGVAGIILRRLSRSWLDLFASSLLLMQSCWCNTGTARYMRGLDIVDDDGGRGFLERSLKVWTWLRIESYMYWRIIYDW